MRKLALTHDAEKFWSGLEPKLHKQIGRAVLGLLRNPEPHDSSLLKGGKNRERRVDAGEYRIVYAVTDDTVEVLVIGKRNDAQVYKQWERMK
ncbi:type II toxin-antitoxin system RelE family toxin [Burkholderia sp. LMU1-1-1.1]|uniref:type II toxin-antitoxin system RelE family toxin n=1 Tax=Burkholderia sp. LMU1-1-1.1 TaxID=3135266 RepID=UPI00343F87A5